MTAAPTGRASEVGPAPAAPSADRGWGRDRLTRGAFSTIGGQPRARLAALDATTGLATAWDPGSNNPVLALAVSGSTVYAGGAFTTIGGKVRQGLAVFAPQG